MCTSWTGQCAAVQHRLETIMTRRLQQKLLLLLLLTAYVVLQVASISHWL
jgi:hypothetical protein